MNLDHTQADMTTAAALTAAGELNYNRVLAQCKAKLAALWTTISEKNVYYTIVDSKKHF